MDKKEIEVNFQAAMAKADELDEIANELQKALQGDFEQSMVQLSGSWTGANAEYYQTKSAKLAQQIQESVKKIRTGASEVRVAAKLIYQAEMAALAVAEARIY